MEEKRLYGEGGGGGREEGSGDENLPSCFERVN